MASRSSRGFSLPLRAASTTVTAQAGMKRQVLHVVRDGTPVLERLLAETALAALPPYLRSTGRSTTRRWLFERACFS
ncbi:hypothetical protein [Catenulispora subtropica]|uniref:hypothetical protein n=1 Tax=Catenulispora subtropica TaxID=450798 RepID=UPI0031E109C6